MITAAMDAAQLGCEGPLSRALLLDAAPGYLTGPERSTDAAWEELALKWAIEELRGAVRAVQPVPPPHGTGIVGYRPADYLEQRGRRTRRHQIGPAELWDALADHIAGTADLARLGGAAERYGLSRYAAVLWTRAAAQGSAEAASDLIRLLRRASPDSVFHAAQWAAGGVSLDDLEPVAWLLDTLHGVAATAAVARLAMRAATYVSLDGPRTVASLLITLQQVGAADAVTALLDRDPAAHARPDDPAPIAWLLGALYEVEAVDAVTGLATRAATHASLDDPRAVASLLETLYRVGAADAVTALLDRDPAAHVSLDFLPGDATFVHPIAGLLEALHRAGAADAMTALATRAATHANLDSVALVASLLKALRSAGTTDAVAVLTSRADSAGISGTILDRPAEALWPGREPNEAPSQLWYWQDLQPKRSQT